MWWIVDPFRRTEDTNDSYDRTILLQPHGRLILLKAITVPSIKLDTSVCLPSGEPENMFLITSEISKLSPSSKSWRHLVNLRHRRWTEVTVFTPVCLCVNSITEKLLDGFRRNLVGGLGMVQGSCH